MFDLLFTLFLSLISIFGITFPNTDEGVIDSVSTTAQVLSVVDGDTIEVLYNGKKEKVRYIGVDTPEPYRDGKPACLSHEATEYNKELVEGKEVTLQTDREDRDQYGRLLRYVYVGETFVNKELIENGFAKTLRIKPNTTYADEFAKSQKEAKESGRGIWGTCTF
jgi:micrococcal nuclease